jgi:soluble lytic murein transglycosylase
VSPLSSFALAVAAVFATACSPASGSSAGAPAPAPPGVETAGVAATADAPVLEAVPIDAEPPLDLDKAVVSWRLDPRLAEVERELAAGKPLAAARAASAARAAAEKAGAAAGDRARLAYLEGHLFAKAGVPDVALDAFKASADLGGPLAPYALLRATELAAQLGKHDAALGLAAKIDAGALTRARLDAATIESLARAGSAEDARKAAARLFSTQGQRPWGWASMALRVAKALAKRPTEEHARAAREVASYVRFDAARGRGADEADKLANELTSRLPGPEQKLHRSPPDAELIARGRRLADSEQSKRALAILDKLAKRRDDLPAAERCSLALARGKALGGVKRKSEAFDELKAGAEVCTGEALAEALMAAGRAAARAHVTHEAMALFGRFEAAFPEHALADDARLEGARAALDGGQGALARASLATIADKYPTGDKVGDALFTLGLDALERGAYPEARAAFERGRDRGKERVYTRAGRFSYFLGRVTAALGDAKAAEEHYAATLKDAPLTYYAALAAARLDEARPGRSKEVLDALLAKGPSSPLPRVPESALSDPRVASAIALASLGDPKGTDDALAALGVKDHSAPPAYYAFGAKLLALAGDAQAAHALLRTSRERDFGPGKFDCDALAFELPAGAAREPWELAFPRPFAAELSKAATESGVPEPMLYALMREESAFLPRALSVADARGLVQVIPPTGARMARQLGVKFSNDSLFEPELNLRIGAKYLAGLRKRFGGAHPLAIAGYNAGPGAPEAWIEERPAWDLDLWVERIPYTETRNYVKRVWASTFAYQILYGGGSLGEITSASTKVPDKRERKTG